jgi:hypothetical protein
VILEIGKKAFEECSNDRRRLVDRLADYEGVVDRVVLDMSVGGGMLLEPQKVSSFIDLIEENLPGIGIGIAGGLGPNRNHLVHPISCIRSYISIDARSELRLSRDPMDPIDWYSAIQYLKDLLLVLD